jgi:transcriptional regulator with XRE-family HTH domain
MSTAPLPGLRRVREGKGFSRAELRHLSGVSMGAIMRAEGVRPGGLTVETAGRLAGALGVPASCLLDETASGAFAARLDDAKEFLLAYRAVHYPTIPGSRKTKEAQSDRR